MNETFAGTIRRVVTERGTLLVLLVGGIGLFVLFLYYWGRDIANAAGKGLASAVGAGLNELSKQAGQAYDLASKDKYPGASQPPTSIANAPFPEPTLPVYRNARSIGQNKRREGVPTYGHQIKEAQEVAKQQALAQWQKFPESSDKNEYNKGVYINAAQSYAVGELQQDTSAIRKYAKILSRF